VRIVHTSDWHAGRVWKGKKRLPELAAALDHLAEFIAGEQVDLLLHSGDVFDSGVPAAEAERTVFRFLKRVGEAGTRSVVIAGNHDSPARLEAWGLLAELVDCHVVARPAAPEDGGVVELTTAGGEQAVVAAVPFAGARTLVRALDLAQDEAAAHATYSDRMRRILEVVCKPFRRDAVNLLVAHAFLSGAVLSRSERRVHVGEEWAVEPMALPDTAHYVALGHIHKPQRVEGAGLVPAYYAGSPLQLDFGEVGEEKSFLVIEAEAGKPAGRIERIPYQGTTPLIDHRATFDELEAEADHLSNAGWLRVTVPLAVPDPDINGKVRRLLPNAVVVRVELPAAEAEDAADRPDPETAAPEVFAAYFRRQHHRPPEPELIDTFRELYRRAGGENVT
jgi:exonuclease SbcD